MESELKCAFCSHVGDTQCDCSLFYSIDMDTLPKKKPVKQVPEEITDPKEVNEDGGLKWGELDSDDETLKA